MSRLVLALTADPLLSRLVEVNLTRAGYRTLVAESLLDLLDLAQAHQPDLIIHAEEEEDRAARVTAALQEQASTAHIPVLDLMRTGNITGLFHRLR